LVGSEVIGAVQVRPAVVVHVGRSDGEGPPGVVEAEGRSGFGERAVDFLPVQEVFAAVAGFALGGGCELAMACDIRVASEKAKFGQPEVGLGLIPGFGGTQRLSRLVSPGMAKEILFTGDMYDAQMALRIGLVNHVVPSAELLDFCKAMAKRIASKGPVAVSLTKEAVNDGLEMDLEKAFTHEADLFALTFTTNDHVEGISAFLEKRKPQFKGN